MGFDSQTAKSQSKSCAMTFCLACDKQVEEASLQILWNSWPRIAHRKLQIAVFNRAIQTNFTAFRSEFHRIADQVLKYSPDKTAICPDKGQARGDGIFE